MNSIKELHKLFLNSNSLSTDSRNCPKGSLFFALTGESFNGNQFAQTAINNGAEFAIVDDTSLIDSPQCIVVDDVLVTLQKLARYHRDQFNIPVIGITGTNGKTTTKELLASVLKENFNTLYTEGNFNNHIGVPLTLLKLNENHEIAIIEMGANHLGEIATLCAIANPSHGLITNVGKAHLEGFGSFENVISTKSELYEYLKINGHVIFHNTNNILLKSASQSNKTINYSLEGTEKTQSSIVTDLPYLQLSLTNNSTIYSATTHLTGRYNYENIISALTIGEYFGINISKIIHGITSYIPTNNRSQITKTDSNTLLLDAYNANPSSMEVAINNFNVLEGDNKIAILGEMKELGTYANEEHRSIINLLTLKKSIKEIILIGEEFMKVLNTTPQTKIIKCFTNTNDARLHIKNNPIKDSFVLIKGSRGMKLESLIEEL